MPRNTNLPVLTDTETQLQCNQPEAMTSHDRSSISSGSSPASRVDYSAACSLDLVATNNQHEAKLTTITDHLHHTI